MKIDHPIIVFLSAMLIMQLTSACSPSAQNLQGDKWVIFTDDQAKELGIGTWFLNPGQTAGYWTPSRENVLAMEKGVATFLQENPDLFYLDEAPAWERLDEYNSQYIGIILEGRKIIYANYFCNSMGTDWKKDFLLVMDGGDCYFQFKYDPASREFFDLQVNGEA